MQRFKFLSAIVAFAPLAVAAFPTAALADETSNSPCLSIPCLSNLIHSQEDYLYVRTLGVPGMGDGSDKRVTQDVKPGSPNDGKVIANTSDGACDPLFDTPAMMRSDGGDAASASAAPP